MCYFYSAESAFIAKQPHTAINNNVYFWSESNSMHVFVNASIVDYQFVDIKNRIFCAGFPFTNNLFITNLTSEIVYQVAENPHDSIENSLEDDLKEMWKALEIQPGLPSRKADLKWREDIKQIYSSLAWTEENWKIQKHIKPLRKYCDFHEGVLKGFLTGINEVLLEKHRDVLWITKVTEAVAIILDEVPGGLASLPVKIEPSEIFTSKNGIEVIRNIFKQLSTSNLSKLLGGRRKTTKKIQKVLAIFNKEVHNDNSNKIIESILNEYL